MSGSSPIVELLLDAGAVLDLPGGPFGTPLLEVMVDTVFGRYPGVRPQQVEVIELLLRRGADPSFGEENPWVDSALSFAIEHGLTDIVDLIRQYCPEKVMDYWVEGGQP